ncbi:MAG TPA: hypothetical protein VFI08_08750, partial [Spirochaetia bacterium]|nr:hypothetical protein [Spirochaetia bacterium]
ALAAVLQLLGVRREHHVEQPQADASSYGDRVDALLKRISATSATPASGTSASAPAAPASN